MNSDEEFEASIADTIALVARGDIAAFAIAGQTTLAAAGALRFGKTYAALLRAAVTANRNLTLRWQFDAPGSAAATARSENNALALLRALEPYANDGRLPDRVRVEFAMLGAVSGQLQRRILELGIACD
jgi:hypothetical protein